MKLNWDFEQPFIEEFVVDEAAIDRLGHVNNARYLEYLEHAAWEHAEALGVGWSDYERLGCVVVAHRHEIDYLKPSHAGDHLLVGTWCTGNDGRLRFRRHYQVIRPSDGATILRALTHWISVDFKTGRPRRMPAEFAAGFQVIPDAPESS